MIELRLRSLVGLLVLVGIAWALSNNRKQISWRVVFWGLGLQMTFGVFVLMTPIGAAFFDGINRALLSILHFSEAGARFLFGNLVFNNVPVGTGTAGSNAPIAESAGTVARTGAYFAFTVLPTIIFLSSLMAILYHLRLMQRVVGAVAWVMRRTMKTSGAETLIAAGSAFVGLMEAPLLARPFLDRLTRSELMAVMTAGLATVSGSVLAGYVGLLSDAFPDIGGHLIAASVMSAPAALVVAKLMIPETERPTTAESVPADVEEERAVNVLDAAAKGGVDGLFLALKVGALLIAFLALLEMLNAGVGWLGGFVGAEGLSLEGILGTVLAPVAWLIGVPWADAPLVAELVGVKTVLNEFVAYVRLSDLLATDPGALQERSIVLSTYALAGFANFGSVAMQIAGIGELAPSRRDELARLGVRALIGGTLAALMTAAVAGVLL